MARTLINHHSLELRLVGDFQKNDAGLVTQNISVAHLKSTSTPSSKRYHHTPIDPFSAFSLCLKAIYLLTADHFNNSKTTDKLPACHNHHKHLRTVVSLFTKVDVFLFKSSMSKCKDPHINAQRTLHLKPLALFLR